MRSWYYDVIFKKEKKTNYWPFHRPNCEQNLVKKRNWRKLKTSLCTAAYICRKLSSNHRLARYCLRRPLVETFRSHEHCGNFGCVPLPCPPRCITVYFHFVPYFRTMSRASYVNWVKMSYRKLKGGFETHAESRCIHERHRFDLDAVTKARWETIVHAWLVHTWSMIIRLCAPWSSTIIVRVRRRINRCRCLICM